MYIAEGKKLKISRIKYVKVNEAEENLIIRKKQKTGLFKNKNTSGCLKKRRCYQLYKRIY